MGFSKNQKYILFALGAVGVCLCSFAALVMFSDLGESPNVAAVQDTAVLPTEIPQPTVPAFLTRCVPASESLVMIIQDGIDDVIVGNYVTEAYAVKSNDFERVYFVAAYIYGDGMEDGVGPGVWAKSGELDGPGLFFSIDGFANEFSSWGDGGSTDAQLSQIDDGAQEAAKCAEYYK